MPVTYLEIENFKSYMGKQTVGPFRDFTSVIGPNGSGKSNLMDAISFVLGVQSRDLRSSQMKDLIFRPPGNNRQQNLRAIVTLYFQDEETNQEIAFARAISPQGVGEYIVNGKQVAYAKYEDRLADIGVLVKARNFLVFQGDVESIARKTPKEMVQLLEQICSSIDLAKDYDNTLKLKEEADAAVLFEHQRQKGFRSERKLLKEQKMEAERFQELVEEKAKLQTEKFLWQLYHIDGDIREQEETLDELQTELKEKEGTEEGFVEALKQAKKKASIARRNTQTMDKARVKCATAVEKLEPEIIQTTEEIKSLKKKIVTADKQLGKKQKEADNHDGDLEQLEKQVAEQREKMDQLEKEYEEIKRDATGDQVSLTEEQEEELEKVKQAAAAATIEPRRLLTALNRQLNSARAKAASLDSELEDAKKTMADTESQVTGFKERKNKLTASMESTKTEVEAKEKELKELNESIEENKARREELDNELGKIDKTLRDARDSRRKTNDEERLMQAIATLKRHFPGVQGRLVDLCRPTQRRFNMAITVAAGKDMDAIVVDTKETGFECIRHLREQRVGTATFLPLDNLQIPTEDSQERTRAIVAKDSRYRLAADCITCEDAIKQAVLYAVGNTVVCDDLDCARELCFGNAKGGGNQQARMKAVTLGGAVISRAGTMTGGVTREDGNKAGRWGAAEIEKLREKKEQLETERSELDSATEGGIRSSRGGGRGSLSGRVEELKNNIGSLKSKSHFTSSDLGYTEKTLREKERQLKSMGKQVQKLEKDLAKVEHDITRLSNEVQQAKENVKNAEEEHLGPFRKKTGLKDLSAYEDAIGERKKEFKEQRHKLMEHIAKLEQKRDYETNRDFKKPLATLEKRIEEMKTKLEKTKKKEAKLEEKVKEAKAELADAEEKVKEATEAEKGCDEEVQAAQADYAEAQNERNKASKAVNSGLAALERLRATLHETLQQARVEEVELPMLDDDDKTRSTVDDRGGSQSQLSSRDGGASLTQDSSTPHFSQANSRKVVKDRVTASKVNYSELKEEMKQRPSEKEEKRMRKEFEEKINHVLAEIEETNPNMKAAEAFEGVTQKLKDINADHEKARENQRSASAAFQAIKQKRARMFNEAFHHIDESLKTIYTDMTKSSKHPLGGNAYLSLDDTEEPYKGGMKFNAMPPMKRFRDMEQLSGGEKTVAALSLLFAIHSYHPAPFFVMDEVDAALDNINLRKVCNYISHRSKTDFQCIVISLKDMFYERSESLIGVCRDVGTSSSRTLTLDLTQFDKNEETNSSKKLKKRQVQSEGGVAVRLENDEEKNKNKKGKKRKVQSESGEASRSKRVARSSRGSISVMDEDDANDV